MIRACALSASLLLLAGCETAVVAGIEDARGLHEAARNYVRENHDRRREIRRICWEITTEQVRALRGEGDHEGAKDLLKRNYPQLVVPATVKKLIKDPEEFSAEPFGCN